MTSFADRLEKRIGAAMVLDRWPLVEQLAPGLDALDRPRPPVGMLSAALWYAEAGLSVFSLQPGSKIPFTGSRGCKDATTDPAKIRAWWGRLPSANIGIATGGPVDVIDVDGPAGAAALARVTSARWPIILGVVSTPRPGGTHLYIESTGGKNRARFVDGLDYRGTGGYVVAPPSLIVASKPEEHSGSYRWRRPLSFDGAGWRWGCSACGRPMVEVEPGQRTHPNCAREAA